MKLILNEPIGEDYRKLVVYAFEVCDRFLFIKHSQLRYSQSADRIIDELKTDLLYSKQQSKWPGTISVPTAMVYHFKNTSRAKDILISASDSLFNWCSPYLPDDLCFLKGDEEWLVTTSHERICYVKSDSESEIETIKNMDGLVYKVIM